MIENATGEDWDDVRLTLSSGSPRTLQADLFRRDWRARDGFASELVEMPVAVAAPTAQRDFDAMSMGPGRWHRRRPRRSRHRPR